MRKLFCSLLLAGLVNGQTPAQWSDDELWKDFSAWVEGLKRLPAGKSALIGPAYAEHLKTKGASEQEAMKLAQRMGQIRRASADRERIYWNGAFKLGGGPNDPLRLLQETVHKRKPGKALDSAMGRGRNAIYLASLGWDVTGYDMSADALAVAKEDAEKAGVKLKLVEAKHETFDFGENQWDLILCSYNYMMPTDANWPAIFAKALRPGGIVIYQSAWGREAGLAKLIAHWSPLRIIRYEDLDAGEIVDDWGPSRTNPTVKLIFRKELSAN